MPEFAAPYQTAIIALIICTIVALLQSFLGALFGFVKAGKTPGAPLTGDHDEFAFRALRTYQNSVENLPAFATAIIAAILVGASAGMINILAMVYVAFRLVYWTLYYLGVGKPAGGPRSIVYVLGWAVNLIIALQALYAVL